VTVSVVRNAKPERRAEFEEWISGLIELAARFPGYLGAVVFRPIDPDDTAYRVVFKFDSAGNLKRWEHSKERRECLHRGEPLQQGPLEMQVLTGLEAWFALPAKEGRPPPPRHKMAVVTWLAVYPLLTTIFFVLGSFLVQLPLPLRTLLMTLIMVPTMFYVVMPGMTRLFVKWLYPEERE
jgi:antibiotic biosynthesis monooxygenase (ABM) superfamily enzyme